MKNLFRKALITSIGFLFYNTLAQAQAPTEQDCPGAVPICDSTYTYTSSFAGEGSYPSEIDTTSCLSSSENNTVWFTFNAQATGDVGFLIMPANSATDYDWAVYDLTGMGCQGDELPQSAMVSCNYSGTNGNTGPDGSTNNTSQNAGGTRFNDYIPATIGHNYVIVIDNFSANTTGFTVDFAASPTSIIDTTAPGILNVQEPVCGDTTLTFVMTEPVLCSTVDLSDFVLNGPSGAYTIATIASVNCGNGGAQDVTFTIEFSPAIFESGNYSLQMIGNITDLCGNIAPPFDYAFNVLNPTDAGPDDDICGGFTHTLAGSLNGITAPSGWITMGDGTFSDSTLLNPVYTPGQADIDSGYAILVLIPDTTGLGLVCPMLPDTMVLTINPQPQVNPLPSPAVTCIGVPLQLDGNPSSGSGTYTTHAWVGSIANLTLLSSPIIQNPIFTSSTAGTYTYNYSVLDNKGCTNIGPITVVVQPGPTASFSTVTENCGLSDGSATVSGNGGTAPYTYLWDSNAAGQTTATATGLSATTYSVTLTDSEGCTSTGSVQIGSASGLTANVDSIEVSCFGGTNGEAIATPQGGTSPYTYLWDDANTQTDSIATGLSAGTYHVTVTDNAGCDYSTNVIVTENNLFGDSISSDSVLCYGGNTGSATVFPTGGKSPYTYIWDAGTGNQTDSIADSLSVGMYYVTVTDDNGCVAIDTVKIEEGLPYSYTISSSDVSCFGDQDGTVTANPLGGIAPFTYQWDDLNSQTTQTASGLSGGVYHVTITDANGCVAGAYNGPQACFEIRVLFVDACFPSTEGLEEFVTFEVGPYDLNTGDLDVTWPNNNFLGICTNPTLTAQINSQITGTGQFIEPTGGVLPAGSQVIFVTSTDATFANTTFPNINEDVYIIYQCSGNTQGHFSNYATTGSLYKTFSMTFGTGCTDSVGYYRDSLVTTTGSLGGENGSGVFYNYPGDATYYNIGCVVPVDTTPQYLIGYISEPAVLDASISNATNETCENAQNGSITAGGTGGTQSYTYQWTTNAGGQTGATVTGLNAGTFTVTLTDAHGCTSVDSVEITEPIGLLANASTVDAVCGNANGSASVNVINGASPITYVWNTNPVQTTMQATGLSAGTYQVTATDNNGCAVSATATIGDTPGVNATTQSTPVTCNGNSDGSATAMATGGASPYMYQWSTATGNQTTSQATGLQAGTYTVTITDNNTCTDVATVTVTQPSTLQASTSSVNTTCGLSNGSVTSTTNGGTPGYSYNWSNGVTASSVQNLSAGTYTVTVNDGNGCSTTASAIINGSSNTLVVQTSDSPQYCTDNTSAGVSASVSGGTSAYAYAWNNGSNSATQSGISAGTYTLTVTDAQGCTATATEIVNVVNDATAGFTVSPQSGSAPLSVGFSNTSSPGTYFWDFGNGNTSTDAAPTQNYPDIGTYVAVLTVTSANGCVSIDSVLIEVTGVSSLNPSNVFSPNGDGVNDEFKFLDMANIETMEVSIYNRWGNLITEYSGPTSTWNGKDKRGNQVPEGTYYYLLKSTGVDGTIYDRQGYITLLR